MSIFFTSTHSKCLKSLNYLGLFLAGYMGNNKIWRKYEVNDSTRDELFFS